MRIIVFWALCWGPPILGNYHTTAISNADAEDEKSKAVGRPEGQVSHPDPLGSWHLGPREQWLGKCLNSFHSYVNLLLELRMDGKLYA